MNKHELISKIAAEAMVSKSSVAVVIDALQATIQSSLQQDREASIPGIGKFSVVQRAARVGRNPRTGEPANIPARQTVKFKASAKLLDDNASPALDA